MRLVRDFMLVFGPISSVFDYLTFGVLWFGLPRPAGAFSDRLVRRIAGDPGAGHLRHPNHPSALAQPSRVAVW